MTGSFLLLLMLLGPGGEAFRESPPRGLTIYHSIREGHDLVLSCPLKEAAQENPRLKRLRAESVDETAPEAERVDQAAEEVEVGAERAEDEWGEEEASLEGAATTGTPAKKPRMILWTRNTMELYSRDGEDFIDISKGGRKSERGRGVAVDG